MKYLHWGRDFEKAEVGVLSRNIVIQGDAQSNIDGYGGHLIIRRSNTKISGVEFTRMGTRD